MELENESESEELSKKKEVPPSNILENMKVKPFPKKFKSPNFFLTNQLEDESKIIDKRDEKLLDVESFMKSLDKKLELTKQTTMKEVSQKLKDSKSKIDILELAKSENKILDIKKTSKKITITEIKQPSITDDKSNKSESKNESKKEFKTKKSTDLEITKKTKRETFESMELDSKYEILNEPLNKRLKPDTEKIILKAPRYYNNNRENFIEFINKLFLPYKQQLIQEEEQIRNGTIKIDCESNKTGDFTLLIHQQLVRDYINLFTPYRGLLLYHGLGSGKTCTSIAISEGLKNNRKIMVLTPASLKENYIDELKKCGDYLYKKNQYWEFIDVRQNKEYIKPLSSILKLSEEYIISKGGAWLINSSKEANYEGQTFKDKKAIDEQINKMILYKYEFIKYNGLQNHHLKGLTKNYTINPFSNKVIIIDEAHNFISRIANKIKNPSSLSMKLYEYLKSAENCKIILLTGTPIINYPNEIGILFNILRGYINCINIKIKESKKSLSKEVFKALFKKYNMYEYIDFFDYNQKSKILNIIFNPYGFLISEYSKDLLYSDTEPLYINNFIDNIKSILDKENIKYIFDLLKDIEHNVCLPDTLDSFKKYFIDTKNNQINTNMFKKRIMGLTSYFKSAQEQLMPEFNDDRFELIELPMSDFQFSIYEQARVKERKLEMQKPVKSASKIPNKTDELYDDSVSTYRIFSRAFCNFVFPDEIKRPMPIKNSTMDDVIGNIDNAKNIGENILDPINSKDIINDEGVNEVDDIHNIEKEAEELNIETKTYSDQINIALSKLEKDSSKFLSIDGEYLNNLSPKFLTIAKKILDPKNIGIHLVYSQFKTLEGIGIFKLVLKENGFNELKIKKISDSKYEIITENIIPGKPFFASYTGDESPIDREIIKNILNNNWTLIPSSILIQLKELFPSIVNNKYGEIIKVLMITSSGAEGISLKNVRFVHIMEPYWHPVRIEQVIGRARRICSHSELEKKYQTVNVFLYIMCFTESQLSSDLAIELKTKDKSKYTKDLTTKSYKIITTDQFLQYDICNRKELLNLEILKNVKESAIDCMIHNRSTSSEKLDCFIVGNPDLNEEMYKPNIKHEEKDIVSQRNKTVKVAKLFRLGETNYAYDKTNNKVYDYDSYLTGKMVYIGLLEKLPNGKYKILK